MSETVLKGGISNVRYIWVSNGDCDDCEDLDGEEFDSADDIPDKPHPNCQCYIEVVERSEDDEECDCFNDAFDEIDELVGNGESLIDEIQGAMNELADFLNEKFIEPVRNIIEDCIDGLEQIIGTIGDFIQNYNDMKEAETIGGDKYFHSKANCGGSQRGKIGEEVAKGISDLREYTDHYKNIYLKGMSEAEDAKDSAEDQEANEYGREQGRNNPDEDCGDLVDVFRPNGLPEEY